MHHKFIEPVKVYADLIVSGTDINSSIIDEIIQYFLPNHVLGADWVFASAQPQPTARVAVIRPAACSHPSCSRVSATIGALKI